MSVRSKRSLGGLGLGMIAVLFIALVILSDALLRSARLDLTEHRLYTVSAGTRSILESLDEPVTLYFFFSRRATEGVPYLRSYGQRVREMLEEFSKHAGPRLRLQVIDPLPFSEAEDQAVSFGLEAVSLGGMGDAVYIGLAGTNAVDGVEVIPFFQPEREALLEYDLARLVWALGNPQRPVVGLVTPLQMMRGFDPQAGGVRDAWVAISQLEQLVELRNLGARPGHIEADIDLLLVVHPKDLDEATLYAVDQFVMRGGQLLAFVDPQADMEALDPLLGHARGLRSPRVGSQPAVRALGLPRRHLDRAAGFRQCPDGEHRRRTAGAAPRDARHRSGGHGRRRRGHRAAGPDQRRDGRPCRAARDSGHPLHAAAREQRGVHADLREPRGGAS
jgi:ABC-type uncharacterized transport system involved in gliding motility auxiliary subunit